MKKQVLVLAAILVLGLLAACSSPGASVPPIASASGSASDSAGVSPAGSGAEVENPLTVYPTVEQAGEALGFAVQSPAWLPDGYSQVLVQTIGGTVLEVRYQNAAGEEIVYRMAQGSEDISGDYNDYPYQKEAASGNLEGILYGNTEGSYNLAVFFSPNALSYSLSFDVPVDEPTILDMMGELAA